MYIQNELFCINRRYVKKKHILSEKINVGAFFKMGYGKEVRQELSISWNLVEMFL